ncbi:demethylmenaquinone methyltransferase [Geobacter sp. OR-1]|uniref:class I SAM-dependent methyltransferase n=1 Tax=Geobacter sp. OR-1 TaxID=1266765 RepID=UPI0005419C51|nr:methyltransferase domain-containing protein [Geobacter sp. OR-1]GAM08491.1 demethylmenaquinone methyltransferase [Geobacter sp. OR-1]
MSGLTPEQKASAAVRETFETVAAGYDNDSLRFFRDNARAMAAYFDPQESIRLLDVATGTGNAALALAGHLPLAQVTGVDFSSAMLVQARAKGAAAGLHNVQFLEMDMQSLAFPDGCFDAAVCAFGIFFVDDMEKQLRQIAAKVKPGGRVLISCFYEGSFSPCVDLFLDRIGQYGIERPPLRWKRIATEERCIALFRDAGLAEIRADRRDLGYYLESADNWWEVVWNGGFRGLVEQLPAGDLQRFREEHLQEIDKQRTSEGIRLNLDVLHVVGTSKG